MLVCYLDDSGNTQDPVATIAGYLGTAEGWARFEPMARAFFDGEGIEYLHTVDLHQRRNQFDGWTSTETLPFARKLFEMVGECAPVGVEFSVDRAVFNQRKAELGMKAQGSPLTMCFRGLLQNMMGNEGIKEVLGWDGVDLSFVVERGKSTEPIVKEFDRLVSINAYGGVLKSLTLEDKKAFIALQAADFHAYFTRRLRCMSKADDRFDMESEFFNAATVGVRVHSRFLATDFG